MADIVCMSYRVYNGLVSVAMFSDGNDSVDMVVANKIHPASCTCAYARAGGPWLPLRRVDGICPSENTDDQRLRTLLRRYRDGCCHQGRWIATKSIPGSDLNVENTGYMGVCRA